MGICGSSTLNSVPILDSVTPAPIMDSVKESSKKEDPSTLGSANLLPRRISTIEGLERAKETIVLVTGASTWFGGHTAKALIDTGYSVRAAVELITSPRVEFLRKMGCTLVTVPDLLEEPGWAEAMAGCAGFVHVNSLAPSPFHTDAEEMIKEAVEGTELALRVAAEAGTVRRVVVTCTLASICGSQRDNNPDHLWSEADKNDAPSSGYFKSSVAKEAKVWELADKYKDKYSVCTVHTTYMFGAPLPGQHLSESMLIMQIPKGKVVRHMSTVCDADDLAAVHVAGLERPEAAGQRYMVSSTDQISSLEMAGWMAGAGASGVDLAAWAADEDVQKQTPKKPSADNRKVIALLGRALVPPATSVERAVASLIRQDLIPHSVGSTGVPPSQETAPLLGPP